MGRGVPDRARPLDATRELCVAAVCLGTLGLLGYDPTRRLRWAALGIEQSRALGLDFTLGRSASVFEGMLHAVAGDADEAGARYSEALEIQRRIGD